MASFPQEPSSVGLARRYIGRVLVGTDPDVIERATMLVSELATNAILHAETGFDINVTYPTPGACVRVEISDGGAGEPRPQQPPPTAEHGRGLQLVAALSDRWGIEASGEGSGKSVWFELTLSPSGRREAAKDARPVRSPEPGKRWSPSNHGLRLAIL